MTLTWSEAVTVDATDGKPSAGLPVEVVVGAMGGATSRCSRCGSRLGRLGTGQAMYRRRDDCQPFRVLAGAV